MDEQGRPYYYSADGSRSEWELPKVRLHDELGCPCALSSLFTSDIHHLMQVPSCDNDKSCHGTTAL